MMNSLYERSCIIWQNKKTRGGKMGCTTLVIDKKTFDMVGDYLPCEEVLDDLVGFFSLFSDKTRLKILCALAISEMCVTDLALTIGLNQTTLSHQLRILRSVGAVSVRREGKIIYYGIKDEVINDVVFKGMDFLSR